MDRHERISRAIAQSRMDANCKPGKTIPCGKACRKPENCKQKGVTPTATPSAAKKTKKSAPPVVAESTPASQVRQFKRTTPKRASRLAQKEPNALNQVRKFERRTPEQQLRSLMKDPAIAKYVELVTTGRMPSDKKLREALGMNQDQLLRLGWKIDERFNRDRTRGSRRDFLKKLKKGAAYRKDALIYRIDSLLEGL